MTAAEFKKKWARYTGKETAWEEASAPTGLWLGFCVWDATPLG